MKKLLDNKKFDKKQKRKRTIKKNNKKRSLIQLIIPFLVIIIVCLLLKKEKKPKSTLQAKELPIAETNFHNPLKFENLLPKLNNTNFNNLDDIFKSRELFINDNNISIQYINFIKPINETEEKNYQYKSYETEENFERFLNKRNNQLSYKEYIEICQNETLIDLNKSIDNNNPIISIIVSSYNKENLIIKTVKSIQKQSLKNIEIIIVDDCSTDNSYIKYFALEYNAPSNLVLQSPKLYS
jgi:hypothetical protein